MPENFDGIKNRKFGIEIEMTGITRCEAAKAIKSDVSESGDLWASQFRKQSLPFI